MFDVGFSELLVIGVVALVVVGPRDLPAMFQTVGRFTARARSMAREFQRAMDDAAKASGMNEAMKDVRDLTSKKSLGLTALENAADKFEKWKPMEAAKPAAKRAATPVKETAAEPAAAEAPKPATARKMGAHTRALSEQIEKDRAERKARAAAKAAAADTPAPEAAKPVKKATRKAPAKAVATAEAAPAAKPKAARKPRQGKTDA